VTHWLRVLLLATLALGTGCGSLSAVQKERAVAIAEAARGIAVIECPPPQGCALPSPLHALGDKAVAESSPLAPLHYATILDEGERSLVARLNLIRSAKTRIDLQTYIFDKDDSARLVIDELVAAAQRGVQVRLLIDQLSAISDVQILAALAGSHRNFSLRVYNPSFGKAKLNYFDYAGSVLCCFRRFNQRMHNKLLVIDDRLGVVGGRNYQDDYYDWDREYNFRDRDVIIAGPEVRQMSANFEAFWNARRSVPVARLNDVGRMLLDTGVPQMPDAGFLRPERIARVSDEANDPQYVQQAFVDTALPVRSVSYVADLPEKHKKNRSGHAALPPAGEPQLDTLISDAKSEVLLQTPYLVLSGPAQDIFRRLRQREAPPRVVVSTNSLAATDNPIVYALAYKYKRRNLRELGFNIYEYKPFPLDPPVAVRNLPAEPLPAQTLPADTTQRPSPGNRVIAGRLESRTQRHRRYGGGSEVQRDVLRTETRPSFLGSRAVNKPLPVTRSGARMGLHAKSLVVDRRIGVIGTHNFDPRSENYNTEGAVIIDDPVFAERLAQSILGDVHPDNSWVVAPAEKTPLVGGFSYSMGKASEALPVLDFWPWRYATNYEFVPGEQCLAPLRRQDPGFRHCYRAVGDFPEVNVGPKWLLVRMLTAFGAGLAPIL
jgi:phosphatidylserine/phosphatidylglycerophosphate/cardiolipin synthase-like enzyme